MGKTDKYRPVDKKKYDSEYSRIFMTEKVMCACDGRACKGICREKNLFRKRKDLTHCPAAHTVEEK